MKQNIINIIDVPNKPVISPSMGIVFASKVGWCSKRVIQGQDHIEKLVHCIDLDKTLETAGYDIYGELLPIEETEADKEVIPEAEPVKKKAVPKPKTPKKVVKKVKAKKHGI